MKPLFIYLVLALCLNINAQIITTIAGSGMGYSGDGGQALNAKFKRPTQINVDAAGNIYIADSHNSRLRKISTNGIITTIAGTGVYGSSGDGGSAALAKTTFPAGVCVDLTGNIYFTESGGAFVSYTILPSLPPQFLNGNRVRKIDVNGIISTIAGTNTTAGYSGDGGLALSAQFFFPNGITTDAVGSVFFVDHGNHCIRKIDTNGIISTVAGIGDTTGAFYVNTNSGFVNVGDTATAGYSGDGGQAIAAKLRYPIDIAIDNAGNLYITDWGNHCIRKVDANGIITTIAGTGTSGFSGDNGLAVSAQLNSPLGIDVDNAGNIYFAEYNNHRIRKIDANGIITTIAGTGIAGFSGDGGLPTAAKLYMPYGVKWYNGKIYFTDLGNSRVRMICPSGALSITASDTTVCAGQTLTLTASGASSYTWSTLQTSAAITVTPSANSVYAVYTSDKSSCKAASQIIISVSPCTGVSELNKENEALKVYPNPANTEIYFDVPNQNNFDVEIFNTLGQLVLQKNNCTNGSALNISTLKPNVYYLKVKSNKHNYYAKFLKE